LGSVPRREMKSHSKLLWLWLPILVILIVTIGANLWNYFFFLYPPKETESTFLKNYTPNSVIEKFEVETASSYSRFSSGRPGRKFVTHTGGFGWHFAMQSKNWMPFMNALRADASAQLVVNREFSARVVIPAPDFILSTNSATDWAR